MMEYIWGVSDEILEPTTFYRNHHAAIDYANEQHPGMSWYQVTEHWWRGVNKNTGHAWGVVRYELH